MINQFRTSNPINAVYLLVYTFLMRIAIFYDLPSKLNFEFLEPYTRFFIQIPIGNELSSALNVTLAALIVYIQAILFNIVINNHSLLNKPGYLPGLLYITGSSLFMPFLILSPALFCNFLLIWVMDKLMRIG